ncbi:MAG: substrate-binding domain-containing protein, partial [Leptolinea sp.]
LNIIRFSGSHDLLVTWMAGHMPEIVSGAELQLNFTGSLGGLMALAENQANIAGCHLWDAESNTYNLPYIAKLFPGQPMTIVRLATRRIGLITAPGNPKNIHQIEDLVNPSVRFVNRQTGSGTRVWLDTIIHQKQIDSSRIVGFKDEKMTHSDVARTIAEGNADVGIGLELAAAAFNLTFLSLAEEPYDLVTYASRAHQEPLLTLFNWIRSDDIKQLSSMLPGYDFQHSGEQINLME